MDATTSGRSHHREPGNKGKLIGQKAPLKPKDIWALRVRLQQQHRVRELAMLNLGIASKLRACDLVSLRVRDIMHGDRVASRAIVQQKKTGRPVQFEITAPAREAVEAWIREAGLRAEDYLFPSRIHSSPHICTRQYARMLRGWLHDIDLDGCDDGTHSMRRKKATLICRKTKNRRSVQLLLDTRRLSPQSATSASGWMTRWRSPSTSRSDRTPRRHATRSQRPVRRLHSRRCVEALRA